jgi:hypothetical protein
MGLVSMRQFARDNSVTVEAIRKAIHKKRLPALVNGKVDQRRAQPRWEAIRDPQRAGRKRGKRTGNGHASTPALSPAVEPLSGSARTYDDARTRREYLRAEREELALAREQGKLVDAIAVRAEFSNMVSNFRSKMLALGHRVAPLIAPPEDRARVCAVIDEAVHGALTELAAKGDDAQ